MNLKELRFNCAKEQKKGLHFILTSIVIWLIIAIIHSTSMPILTKNLFTFCATSILVPMAYMISRIIKVNFSNKENPLNNLGVIFSINQFLYILIAMWIYSAVPEKMVMVLAIIFGAHLLPFGWLYKSMSYKVMSVIISIAALVVGNIFEPYVVAIMMIIFEIVFSILLIIEVKALAVAYESK